MKFLKFSESPLDPTLYIQLLDLARALSKNKQLTLAHDYLTRYDFARDQLFLSRFWDSFDPKTQMTGYKSDVYLQAFGHYHFTDQRHLVELNQELKRHPLRRFGLQWFALAEQLRVLDLSLVRRKGMKRVFDLRKRVYRHYFRDQGQAQLQRKHYPEALLCTLFLLMTNERYEFPFDSETLKIWLHPLEGDLLQIDDCERTDQLYAIWLRQFTLLAAVLEEEAIRDAQDEYFSLPKPTFPFAQHDESQSDDLTVREQGELLTSTDEAEQAEQMPTWHRETPDQTESRLQFDLETGKPTARLQANMKETDDRNQDLGVMRGSSRASKRLDYTEQSIAEGLEHRMDLARTKRQLAYGRINLHVTLRTDHVRIPAAKHIAEYSEIRNRLQIPIRSLQRTIEKTMEHKRTAILTKRHYGRLSRKLLDFFTEEQPRLFEQKASAQEFDACFGLLIDSSSSMEEKVGHVLESIVLFHEVLRRLRIVHAVTAFWEEASLGQAAERYTYFQHLIRLDNCLLPSVGPRVMQWQTREDNRDGYAIRRFAELFQDRAEKRKVIIVLTDGEPAADQYVELGVQDTYQAVQQVRKSGIELVGIMLGERDQIDRQKGLMRSIYGTDHLVTEDVTHLPQLLAPLLKKKLLTMV
jgi:nitric oxide reductase activation protein